MCCAGSERGDGNVDFFGAGLVMYLVYNEADHGRQSMAKALEADTRAAGAGSGESSWVVI